MSARQTSPGGVVKPALEPAERWEVQEHLAQVPESAPLHDYLAQRLNDKVPTAILSEVA